MRLRLQITLFSTILLCAGITPWLRGMKVREQENGDALVEPADRPAMILGKTIDAWLAALKDRDPTVRKRSIEVLAERALDPAIPPDEKARLQIAVTSTLLSDKDAEVRRAAAFFVDLFKKSSSPEIVDRLLEERRRAVDPTRRVIRLVDAKGRPIEGAVASTYFQRDADREPSFMVPEPLEAATSNARGLVALKLEIPGHLDGEGIYAIRQLSGRPLVGLRKVTREELDMPITITMHPACRVLFRIDSKGLPALETKYRAELTGSGWWRAAYVVLGGSIHGTPRPLFASSTKGELEFLLPPGRVTIHAYGSDVKGVGRSIEIRPDDREQVLGTFDLAPSANAEQGRFPNHHRVRQNRTASGDEFIFRRIRFLPLRGMARASQDVAFSPDGKLLASAHFYNVGPGEVMLWDTTTGAKTATLSVADRGVVSVAFSPDGKMLASSVYALDDPRRSGDIVVWDVPHHREAQRISGNGGQISALDFSPDGKIIAGIGADRAVRFWDVVSGHEIRRIDATGSGRALAFSPDGKLLVVAGVGRALTLLDVAASRLRANLEPENERFGVYSIAIAPDGRTLAAAGVALDINGVAQQGQVRLYNLAAEPFARRAVLTFDRDALAVGRANDRVNMCSDVAFTPDGRVLAVGMQKIRIWDAATSGEFDAFERGTGGGSDRIAVSPDGRWLAVTSPFGTGVQIFDIPPPGPS
jgi:WD40 repeat protein